MTIDKVIKERVHYSEKGLLLKIVRGERRKHAPVQLDIFYLSENVFGRNPKWYLKVLQKYVDAGALIAEETDGNPFNRKYSVNVERLTDYLQNEYKPVYQPLSQGKKGKEKSHERTSESDRSRQLPRT